MSNPLDPVEAIFDAALQMPPDQRASHLRDACGDDAQLRRRIEALLHSHENAGDFMDKPAIAPDKTLVMTTLGIPLSEKPGDQIGRYKLREQIGEGGCGVVYVAEQEEPVRRRVALKVIKLGMDTRQVVARFEAERQALALMDHPHIAKVLDAGATDTGRPYFVMELVRGIKITDYCDKNNLSTEDRLKLFIQVCSAIQHAHQKGIIHRDIKPSNILVTLHDGVPVPKVIDFGIAKATSDQRLTDKTIYTAFEQFIGTPAYMSPEQAEMSGLDIDTRSDIYSLGVLLYELLTGRTPFDAATLLKAGLDQMRRIIREQEPQRPSTRLSTLEDADLTAVASHRHAEPPKLVNLVRGDLDWIVMKSLEKDRTRRYDTANSLAMDLQRHLANEPVLARPPGGFYRFQKLVRRNKLAFVATSAVAAALIIGLGVATWMFLKEKQARERAVAAEQEQVRSRQLAEANEQKALTEATRSKQVAQFMKDMLAGVGPRVAQGRDTTLLREILDQTAQRLEKDLTNQPEVEADLRGTLGFVYFELGDCPSAETMQRQAFTLRQRLHGGEHRDTLESQHGLAQAIWRQGKLAEAEELYRDGLATRRKLLGDVHLEVAESLRGLGLVSWRQAELIQAEAFYREALSIQQKLLGDTNEIVAATQFTLAIVLDDQGRLTEAEAMYREALATQRKLLGNDTTIVALTLCRLGNALRKQSKLSEAETVLNEAVASQRKLLNSQHPDLTLSLWNLALVHERQGKMAKALSLYREAAENGGQGAQTALGRLYANGKRVTRDQAEADKWYRKAFEQVRSMAENGNIPAQYQLASMYDQGRGVATNRDEAIHWYRKSAENGFFEAQYQLGWAYAMGNGVAKDPMEAVKWYRRAAEKGHGLAQHALVRMYDIGDGVEKDANEANKWRRKLVDGYRKSAEEGDTWGLNALAWTLATSENVELRDGTNAIVFAEKAVSKTNRKDPMILDTLAAAYAEAGQFDKAVLVQKEAMELLSTEDQKKDYAPRLILYESNTPYREAR